MLLKLDDHLFIGDQKECALLGDPRPFVAVLHACKNPCHLQFVGYRGSLPPTHAEYLVARRGSHLALNIIDPALPLFRTEVFLAGLDFLDEWTPQGSLLCHCNNGLSRAPSIAMLWLAKRAKAFLGSSYLEAQAAFRRIMPRYQPGKGIKEFLRTRWEEIG